MQNIAIPNSIKFEKGKEKNTGKVIIEPFYPGYGVTLGNSLRRILLSSLPGAAPIGVKIKNVDHEFTAIPHLKEDILEFILNLKQIKLKVFSEEIVELELDAHGKKEIKASDIKENSLVEIANKDLVLGHITDMSGSLNAKIFVAQGMGYVTIESRESREKEIDYIDMDSIFSPVIATGIKVENVRVGKMTNWDKLVIDIKTDGTITFEDAFKQAVNILIEQFSSLVGLKPEDAIKKAKKLREEADKKRESADNEETKDDKPLKTMKAGSDKEEKKGLEPAEPVKRKRGRPRKIKEEE